MMQFKFQRSNITLFFLITVLLLLSGCQTAAPDEQPFVPPTINPAFATAESVAATPRPPADESDPPPTTAVDESDADPEPAEVEAPSPPPSTADIALQLSTANSRPFPKSLLGINVPAWLGADTIGSADFQARATSAGLSLVRIPGGSWSNYYDWLACEREGQGIDENAECFWPWAASPSDFVSIIDAIGGEAMYTVNANGTAQEAAALVAFFNGAVDDETVIGVDRLGRDWGTVGRWAQLRIERGLSEPINIRYWEIGNEIYGGNADSGRDCTDFGWEDVWTCDGTEYVQGIEGHDGFLAYVEAMKEVDPTIQIGAVGVPLQSEWSNWGVEVLQGAAEAMDFYVIHHYGFFTPPAGMDDILLEPTQTWPAIMADFEATVQQIDPTLDIPVAVTEFNLFSFQENDSERLMTRAINAFYITDVIGQMAENGVDIATHWNLANGQPENGTDYGLIHQETFDPYPQYFVYPLWDRFGDKMLELRGTAPGPEITSFYAGQTAAGKITLLVINKSERDLTIQTWVDGKLLSDGVRDTLIAPSFEADTILFNDQSMPLALPPSLPIAWEADGTTAVPPRSITLFTFSPP